MINVVRTIGLTLFAAALAAGSTGRVVAGTVTFAGSGTFADGATFGGTLTIDTTAGLATASALTVHTPVGSDLGEQILMFNTISFQGTDFTGGASYQITMHDPGFDFLDLFLPTTTLVGYAGGPLGSDTMPVAGEFISAYRGDPNMTKGSLSAAPEPSSLVLAGLAAAIGAGVVARKAETGQGATGA